MIWWLLKNDLYNLGKLKRFIVVENIIGLIVEVLKDEKMGKGRDS